MYYPSRIVLPANISKLILFDKNKVDLFLKDLNTKLNLLSYKNNIEDIYHNFTTTLSTSIKKFSIEVLCKKKNRISNPWYVKRLANGKAKDIKGYQDEILKIGGPILIPHIHKLFNLAVKQGFPKPWTQSLIVPIFKSGDKSNPSNYRTIMISPILAKLYGSILEKKISIWLESHGKRAKGQPVLEVIIQPWTTLSHLGSLQRSVTTIKPISFVVSLTLGNILTLFLGPTFGIG
jgi:hypothetical protein